jgi:hypothetical protein
MAKFFQQVVTSDSFTSSGIQSSGSLLLALLTLL